MLCELIGVRLDPLCRSKQSRLLSIPRGVDDRSLRPPSLRIQSAECARLLELADESGDGILRAIDPRIVMISADHPFICFCGSRNLCDYIVDRLETPVRFDSHVHFCGPRAESVG